MKADIYRCTWDSGWTQYHDEADPMPTKWDDDPPDEVAAFVLKIEAEAEINRLRHAMQQTLDENGHLADGENCTLILLKRALAA